MPSRSVDGSGPAPLEWLGMLSNSGAGSTGGASRAEQVAAQLEAGIALGLLEEGTWLPPEAQLATALSTSQMTLRVALATLRGQGLIETVRGRRGGSLIRDSHASDEAQFERRLLQTGTEHLRDVGDLYGAVASGAARLAADRADDREIEHLAELAAALPTVSSLSDHWRTASRFQIAVGVAAQSSRMTATLLQVQVEIATLRAPRLTSPEQVEDTVAGIQAVADAVREHDTTAAAATAGRNCQLEIDTLIEQRLRLLIETEGQS